jgi:Ca-activated chloride channel family protein
VEINQSKTTTLKIPEPGQTTIQMPTSGFGSLYQMVDGQAIWLLNLNNQLDLNIPMLPGKYMAVWKAAKLNKSSFTKIKNFEVKSGYSSIVTF